MSFFKLTENDSQWLHGQLITAINNITPLYCYIFYDSTLVMFGLRDQKDMGRQMGIFQLYQLNSLSASHKLSMINSGVHKLFCSFQSTREKDLS